MKRVRANAVMGQINTGSCWGKRNAARVPALATRLGEEGHWNRMLSLGEQQRLGLTRALLHKPQFLFLDEAPASLDEPSEAAVYKLIGTQLPDTTIVSIGHRTTLHAFHQRNVTFAKGADGFTLDTAATKPN